MRGMLVFTTQTACTLKISSIMTFFQEALIKNYSALTSIQSISQPNALKTAFLTSSWKTKMKSPVKNTLLITVISIWDRCYSRERLIRLLTIKNLSFKKSRTQTSKNLWKPLCGIQKSNSRKWVASRRSSTASFSDTQDDSSWFKMLSTSLDSFYHSFMLSLVIRTKVSPWQFLQLLWVDYCSLKLWISFQIIGYISIQYGIGLMCYCMYHGTPSISSNGKMASNLTL